MAILENIRKRTTVLILIIGLALFAFVISGVITGNDFSGGKIGSTIAEVNGEPISREDFSQKLEQAQRGQARANSSATQLVNRIYDQEVRNTLLEQQFEKLGIDAERDEIVEYVKNTGFSKDPAFLDDKGFFNEEVFKTAIADWKENDPFRYDSWVGIEKNILRYAKEQIYFDLIKAGSAATLAEGQFDYKMANDKVDFQYVRVPYTSIPDSTVQVSKAEIEAYINEHIADFKQENARDIRFVFFEEKASAADENVVKEELTNLLSDTVEYIEERNTTDTIPGFRGTQDMEAFLDVNSDTKFDTVFKAKNDLPAAIREVVFSLGDGEVHGPYKEGDAYKLSRVMARKPNGSVKASHILFAYEGAQRANPDIKRTKEEAEEEAKKMLAEAKKPGADFTALARDNSDGPSAPRGGDLGYFQEGVMADAFNDFSFNNPVGTIGMVETDFGYHIIKVDDKQDLVQVATLSREIQPSETTINSLFEEATKFEMAALDADAEAFADIAKENKQTVRPVNKIKEMDENLPGLDAQRRIVQWAFNADTNVGDVKRFDLSNGYAIVQLTKKYSEGTMSVEDASSSALPKIRKEKKAEMIKTKNSATSLEDFASSNSATVSSASAVTRKSPTVPGAGREPLVVGTAFALADGETSKLIAGESGVFMIKLTKKTEGAELTNFSTFSKTLTTQNRNSVNSGVYNALKEGADIEDNRATFY